jgi:hypothetical protein
MTPATLSLARAGPARPASRIEGALQTRATYELAGCAGLILHLSLALPIYSWTDRIAGWLLLVFLLVALRDYVRRRVKRLPVFLLVAAQVYLFYGIPQFSQEAMWLQLTGYYSPSAYALSWALWLAVLGEAAFLAGYTLTLRCMRGGSLFDRILPKPRPAWSTAVLVYLVPSLILYVLDAMRPDYIPVTIRMAVLQFFNAYLGLTILLYLGYRHKDRRSLLAAWGMIAVMALIGFIQGMMGNIVFPVFMGFVAAWLWARAIQVRWLVLIIVATIIVNPVKNRFRILAWGDMDVSSAAKVASRLEDWSQAFVNAWSGGQDDSTRQNIMESANRTSDLIPFAHVIDSVPWSIPYNRGDGMEISFFYWVPRIFWPSKPESTDLLYNRYAVDFGYSTIKGTRTTTVGASVFTEGYWNFGAIGVLFFMGGAGSLLALLLGHNGRRGDASTLAAMAYLGGTMLLLSPLVMAIPGAVTFTAGVFVAMWSIERIAVLPH